MNTFGRLFSGYSAPERKKIGITKKVHDQLKALHVLQAQIRSLFRARQTGGNQAA